MTGYRLIVLYGHNSCPQAARKVHSVEIGTCFEMPYIVVMYLNLYSANSDESRLYFQAGFLTHYAVQCTNYRILVHLPDLNTVNMPSEAFLNL